MIRQEEIQIQTNNQIKSNYFGQVQKLSSFEQIKKNKNVRIAGSLLMLFLLLVVGLSLLDRAGIERSPEEVKRNKIVKAKKNKPQILEVPVLVARTSLQVGNRLNPKFFTREMRKVSEHKKKIVGEYEQIENFYAAKYIAKGTLLDQSYLAVKIGQPTIAPKIPEGYRAVAITVNQRSSVEGWAIPGTRVDVYWTSSFNGQKTLTLIVDNAKILSAERIPEDDPVDESKKKSSKRKKDEQGLAPVPTTVTLMVSQKDAAKIQLASTMGTLSLSLRGESDQDAAAPIGRITARDLFGIGPESTERFEHDGVIRIKDNNGKNRKYYIKNGEMIPADKQTKKKEDNIWEEEKTAPPQTQSETNIWAASSDYDLERREDPEVVVRLVKYYD